MLFRILLISAIKAWTFSYQGDGGRISGERAAERNKEKPMSNKTRQPDSDNADATHSENEKGPPEYFKSLAEGISFRDLHWENRANMESLCQARECSDRRLSTIVELIRSSCTTRSISRPHSS